MRLFASRRRSRALFGATVLTGALALAACGGQSGAADGSTSPRSGPASSGAPGAESLVVYSGRAEDLIGPLLEKFSTETGIETEVRYGDSAELAAQLLEEGGKSPADVFIAQDAGALGAVSSQGLFQALPQADLDQVAPQYRAEDGTWVGVNGRSRVIAYDSQQVQQPDVPTSVFELTDPTWQGQVGIAPTNASFQSFVTAMRLTNGDDATQQWLSGLVANGVQTFEKNGLILDAVNSGQIKLGLINHYYWYEKAADVGADAMRAQIAFAAPGDPGALVNVSGVGMLQTGADSPADRLVSYLLAEPAQTYFAEKTFEYPLSAGVSATAGLPPLSSLQGPPVLLEKLEELPATQEMLREVGLI